MKLAIALALTLPLHGCLFFFYIPGSALEPGNACIDERASVGSTVTHSDGRTGTVQSVYGRSERCKGVYPVLADVAYQ